MTDVELAELEDAMSKTRPQGSEYGDYNIEHVDWLVRHLEPSLQGKPYLGITMGAVSGALKKHGLENKTMVELSWMGRHLGRP